MMVDGWYADVAADLVTSPASHGIQTRVGQKDKDMTSD